MSSIPVRTGDIAPASFAQELLFLLDRSAPGMTAYNVPRALRLRGTLNVAALQASLDALVARHEVLRTTIEHDGGTTIQRVHAARPVTLERIDLRAVAPDAREAAIARLLHERSAAHLDLGRDQLLAAALMEVDERDHVLFLLTHHIAFDGWSKSVLLRELSELYSAHRAGRVPELAPLPIQYADYASWERSDARQGEIAEHLAYWREQLRGPLPALELPTDRRRASRPGPAGAHRSVTLPPETVSAIKQLAAANGGTMYMVLLAAYQTLLHRYTGQPDIVVGSPVAGRSRPEVEGLIGYFANTLPLRTRFDTPQSFAQLIESVCNTVLDAFEHEELPLEQLALELQRDGRSAEAPLFQVVLTMEDTVAQEIAMEGLEVESLEIAFDATKFDLTMMVAERPNGLRLNLWYRTELFDAATIDRALGHFVALIDAAIANPETLVSDLPLLTEDERAALASWNPTPRSTFETSVAERVAQQAKVHPDRVAVLSGEEPVLTYAELDRRARALAERLRSLGVSEGDRVGLRTGRSVDAIVGILGIWQAGGAYVPLTPDLPESRVARILAAAGVRLIVTQESLASVPVPTGAESVVMSDAVTIGGASLRPIPASRSAYVLFTSGSTGEPKGVVVTHGNLAEYTTAIIDRLEVPPEAAWHWATVSTLAADLGHTVVFPALVTGGTLHVVPERVTTDMTAWAEHTAAQPIDVLKITPSHLRALLGSENAAEDRPRLPRRWLVLGGEACPWALVKQVRASASCRVLNHYGPTETTVGVCTFEVTDESITALEPRSATVPIGRPLAHATAEVLDAHGARVPIGVVGELHLGGFGVADGYLGRPDLTAERFSIDPLSSLGGARRYRTGDSVRRLVSGDIEFLGRLDGQAKVRGYRVELGEIEHVLASHPGVAQCAVMLHASEGGDGRLVAYVVPRTGGYAAAHAERISTERAAAWVAAQLPEYMVPATVVLLDALPLTANGKIDRRALRDPDLAAAADTHVAPRTPTETALAAIWTDVLKKDRIGVTESFMALGGQSLLAIRVLGKLSRQFSVRLPLRTLFDSPTIAELAVIVDTEVAAAKQRELEALLQSLDGMSDDEVQRMLPDRAGGESP